MDEMKYDMMRRRHGARRHRFRRALRAAAATWSAWSPTCENMPDGRAVKPGDIVTSASGPDRRDPQHRCRGPADPVRCTALCAPLRARGRGRLRDPDRRLRDRAGPPPHRRDGQRRCAGRANWSRPACAPTIAPGSCRSPRSTPSSCSSNFADMANIGGREGGAITAAAFLGKFTQGMQLGAHGHRRHRLDQGGAHKGATGRPTVAGGGFPDSPRRRPAKCLRMPRAAATPRVDFYVLPGTEPRGAR